MKKLLQFLKPYAATVAVIFCVLMIQAYSDLSLPSYTSDIVNVGIQQGGIDETIPNAISESKMEQLLLMMKEEDAEIVKEAYSLKTVDTGYAYG